MPGLVPGIHVLAVLKQEGVDGRDEPGHDETANHFELICAACRGHVMNMDIGSAARARLRIPRPSPTIRTYTLGGGFMLAVRSRNFQLGLMLATALSVSIWPAASRAYTPEQEQACTNDAFRLCSAEIPDVDRVTLCMARNKSQLSPGCRAQFRPEPEAEVTPVAVGRPVSIRPAHSRKPVSAKSRKSKKKPRAT